MKKPKRRVRYVAIVPTLLTLGNGVSGLAAMYLLLGPKPDYFQAGALILLAMAFDGLDGKVARATRSTSPFGAQLDSLCDAISFGAAPSLLMVSIMTGVYGRDLTPILERVLWGIGAFYACAAFLRLARFNVESTQDDAHQSFSGLPSPGAGGVLASGVMTYCSLEGAAPPSILAALPVVAFGLGLLMVSRIRYAHVLNRLLRTRRPFEMFIQATLVIVLIYFLHWAAVFTVFVGYAASPAAAALRRLAVGRAARRPELHEKPYDPSVH